MSPVEPGFQALEQRRGYLDSIRENTSRLAFSQCSFRTHGWGEFKLPEVAYFTSTFVDRPTMSAGLSIDGDALVLTRYPRVTAGVYRWLRDVKGFYTGAWIFFVVDTATPYITLNTMVDPPPDLIEPAWAEGGLLTPVVVDPGYDLIHDLTFTGIAIKALPSHLLDS